MPVLKTGRLPTSLTHPIRIPNCDPSNTYHCTLDSTTHPARTSDQGKGPPLRFLRPALLAAAVLVVLGAPAFAQQSIIHELGTTEVPSNPTRIIGLEFSFTDALLRLGVTPAGVPRDANPLPLLDALTEGIPSVGTRAQPNLEAIAAAQPDLIIADLTRHAAIYDQLSLIAPTLVFNSLRGSYEDILSQFQTIGDIVGKSAEAAQIIAAHRTAFEQARANTNPDAPGFLAAVAYSTGFTVHSTESFSGSLLVRLGRRNIVEPVNGETQFEMSLEGLAALDPATIVIFRYRHETTPVDEWSDTALWQSLQAVRNDRVYVFDRDNWTRARGLLALQAVFDEANASGLLADEPPTEGYAP